MTTALMSSQMRTIRWTEEIEYPQAGLRSKILLEDENCRYILMSLATGMHIIEHCNPRNATVNVIEGKGTLILGGEEHTLELDVFIFIPANVYHSVRATSNLSFLLTLSEYDIDSSHSI